MNLILESVQMAGLAFVTVALWTLRVALTARARRAAGSLVAGAEAIVFVLAFSRVAEDVGAMHRLLGYAAGVTIGTLVGMLLDESLSTGQSMVRAVTEGRDLTLVHALQQEGWPVTYVPGGGPNGDVTVAFVAVDDRRVASLVDTLREQAPNGFWTIERLKSARAGTLGSGWLQVGQTRGRDLVRRLPKGVLPGRGNHRRAPARTWNG